MASTKALLEVDPLCLPPGMQVGSWRILGWKGRGAYGTVYRVELVGHEQAGPFALKMAMASGDKRFVREAWLLQRIRSPHVPRLHAQGVWEHPAGAFPYLIMDWIDGQPLYEWSSRRNPDSWMSAGLLAQVARALEATHAAGGLHRDVKGANVLVRPADGRAFLTDFGAGDFHAAATLTSKLLPPGTPAYRSPEAWGFLELFRRHPTIHYPASSCDDLFALGVMAYRLLTDEYPPSTHPHEPGADVWREGARGPLPPRELNPRVSQHLDALVLRLLSVSPDARFGGNSREAAEGLEQAAVSRVPSAREPLFTWGHEYRPRVRSPESVRSAESEDAVAKAGFNPPALEEPAPSQARPAPMPRPASFPGWGAELGVALLALLLAGLLVALFHREPGSTLRATSTPSRERDVVSVGDDTITAPVMLQAPSPPEATPRTVALPVPEQPKEGQRKPPCDRFGEVLIRGGCWYLLGGTHPPCKDDAYEWKGACYAPVYAPQRQPTSTPLPSTDRSP